MATGSAGLARVIHGASFHSQKDSVLRRDVAYSILFPEALEEEDSVISVRRKLLRASRVDLVVILTLTEVFFGRYIRKMSNNRNGELKRIADVMKALSNPSRLQVFLRLVSCCPAGGNCNGEVCACVGEIGQNLEISPSTVSHHLKELRNAGLILMERHGQRVECSVDFSTVQSLIDFFNSELQQD